MHRPSTMSASGDPWKSFYAIGRLDLAHLPTPLQPLRRLSAYLGGPQIWVKRDDCTGLALGGNKARKLDYVLHKAVTEGVEIVVTSGAVQSNHARMTAAACAMLGIECHLVLEVPAGVRDESYERSGNRLLDTLFGATIHPVPAGAAPARVAALGSSWTSREVMIVPPGASTPLGALGYVRAARELAEQAEAIGLRIDRLMLATGSGGTLGGLLAGLKALDHPARILAVALKDDSTAARRALDCARGALALAGLPAQVSEADFDLTYEHIGEGYSIVTPQIVEAVSLLARTEGILFDPVYTGKMLLALIARVRRGEFTPDQNVVLLHSGGVPALFSFDAFQPEPVF